VIQPFTNLTERLDFGNMIGTDFCVFHYLIGRYEYKHAEVHKRHATSPCHFWTTAFVSSAFSSSILLAEDMFNYWMASDI